MSTSAASADPASLRSGALWILAGQAVVVALGFGTNVIVARALGAAGQGAYALALLVPTLGALLLNAGLPAAGTHFAGSGRIRAATLASNALVVAALAGLVALAMALAATDALATLLPGVPHAALLLALAATPVVMLRQSLAGVLLGLQRMARPALVDVAQAATALLAVAGLLPGVGLGPEGAVAAYGLGFAVATVAATLWLRRVAEVRWEPRADDLRRALAFGLRGNVGVVLQFFTYRLDLVLVNLLVGSAAAGVYSVSTRLVELLWLLPAAVGSVVFARVSATSAVGPDAAPVRAFWATLGLTAAAGGGLAVAGPVVLWLFGKDFQPSYQPLLVLLPGAVLLGGAGVLANALAGQGRPGLVSLAAALTLVVTVVLDVALIPPFGIAGAAAASTVAYTAYALLVVAMYLRATGMGTRAFVEAVRTVRLRGSGG